MSKKILVVNDNDFPRKYTVRILEEAGYQCSQAANGLEAISQFESGEFDIIITNWHMPIINGLELISLIRNLRVRQPKMILEVFAWTDEAEALAIVAGADYCYNHNGINKEELLYILNKMLEP